MMKFISLFAGIGGMDLGFERAGFECVAQVEINEWCQKILTKHWPNVPKFKDVHDVGIKNLPSADVIIGGFPCQPHSVAGNRKGAEDDRNLWPEYLRIIKELKPRWVVGENVPGIITTILDSALSDLESEGYEVTVFNLPACGFDAPHKRERIFIVGNSEHARQLAPQVSKGITQGSDSSEAGQKSTRELEGSSKQYAHVADNDNGRHMELGGLSRGGGQKVSSKRICENVVYATSQRQHRSGQPINARDNSQNGEGETNQPISISQSRKWATEPSVGRVAHGIPRRVDRLRGLGNAVVPQVAQFLAENIMIADKTPRAVA